MIDISPCNQIQVYLLDIPLVQHAYMIQISPKTCNPKPYSKTCNNKLVRMFRMNTLLSIQSEKLLCLEEGDVASPYSTFIFLFSTLFLRFT